MLETGETPVLCRNGEPGNWISPIQLTNLLKASSSGSKSPTFGPNLPEARHRNHGYASSPQTDFATKLDNFVQEEKP